MAVDSKNNFWKEFGIWLVLNIVFAGFVCIGSLLLIDLFLGHKGWFYVINKIGYTGYFYAWSISLLAGSLSYLLRCVVLGQKCKGKAPLFIFSIVLLLANVVSYLLYNVQMSDINAEKVVKNLDLKELAGEDLYTQYDTKKIDADTFIARIWETKNTDSVLNYFEENIDKKQQAETLLQVKVKIEDPRFHWNLFYIALTVLSLFVALATFILTYPKPENDKEEGAE